MVTSVAKKSYVADSSRTAAGLNILAGLWLVASPWIFRDPQMGNATYNSIILGLVVAAFSAAQFFSKSHLPWLGYITALVGVWAFVSPWVFNYASDVSRLWNNLILGIIVVSLGVLSAFGERTGTVSPPRMAAGTA